MYTTTAWPACKPVACADTPTWHIVESRRVHGKPRPIPLAYLGKADALLARLQATEPLRPRSGAALATAHPRPLPVTNDGLTVGQTLTLIGIGRACHATSKRGSADWARTASLGDMTGTPVERLTSQHFWDQMDQVPVESLARMEREIVWRVLTQLALPVDTLPIDATNFFTFIASTNARPTLPARGRNRQKRDDLRQVGVALLCARHGGLPLWHQVYGGQVADATCFADVLPAVRQRLVDLHLDVEGLTIVYDKGNVSRANQALVDGAHLHYAHVHPAPSPKRCYVTTAQGRVLFDIATDEGPARDVPPEAHRRFRADLTARHDRNQQDRAAQLALHEEKKRYIAERIARHGTPEQQARQTAGVLPMDEAIEAITDQAFTAVADRPVYTRDGTERLQAHLRQLPEYADVVISPADLVVVSSNAVKTTAEQWAVVQHLQKDPPDATVTFRAHRLVWSRRQQAPSLTLFGVPVTEKVGPFTLRREYDVNR